LPWTLPRVFVCQKSLDCSDVLWVFDPESAVFRKADNAILVDENAVRDSAIVEQRRCYAFLIDDGRILGIRRFDEWFGQMRAAVFERDGDEFEVVRCVARVEILPAWQLFAASSPRAPEEEQELLPT